MCHSIWPTFLLQSRSVALEFFITEKSNDNYENSHLIALDVIFNRFMNTSQRFILEKKRSSRYNKLTWNSIDNEANYNYFEVFK